MLTDFKMRSGARNNSIRRFLAFGILIIVPLTVLVWHGLAICLRPAHLKEVVAELGSIGRFTKTPLPNHADTMLLFSETTERGNGIYLCEVATGKRILIFDEINKGPNNDFTNVRFLGWAPDDSSFAYIRRQAGWELVFCDGKTGETQDVVPVNAANPPAVWVNPNLLVFADNKKVLQAVKRFNGQWIRPIPFKYFRDASHIPMPGSVQKLTVYGPDTVAWLQDGIVWKCGVEADEPQDLSSQSDSAATGTMDGGLVNIGYTWYEMGYNVKAPDTGLPLQGSVFSSLSASNHVYAMAPDYAAPNAVLINNDLHSASLKLQEPVALKELSFLNSAGHGPMTVAYTIRHQNQATDSGTINVPNWFSQTNAAYIANGRHQNNPDRFETNKKGQPRLYSADVVVDHPDSPVVSIDFTFVDGRGHAAIFAVSGTTNDLFVPLPVTGFNADIIQGAKEVVLTNDLTLVINKYLSTPVTDGMRPRFVIESRDDQPPGIWEYTQNYLPRCVVPNVEESFHYVMNAPIETGQVTNAAGETLTYYLLSPVRGVSNSKHQLILGIMGINEKGFTWSKNHEAFANLGSYFVTVDRHNREYGQWAEDAFTVYQALAARLPVDTNNVYLYASSAGCPSVYSLLADKPNFWRGAILFSPVSLPDPASINNKRLLFDCDSEYQLPQRAAAFQDAAALLGNHVTLLVHPGLKHTDLMRRLERARMRQALILLSN